MNTVFLGKILKFSGIWTKITGLEYETRLKLKYRSKLLPGWLSVIKHNSLNKKLGRLGWKFL